MKHNNHEVLRLIHDSCGDMGVVDPDTLICSYCHDHADPGVKVCACTRCKQDAYEDTWTESDGELLCEDCVARLKEKMDEFPEREEIWIDSTGHDIDEH